MKPKRSKKSLLPSLLPTFSLHTALTKENCTCSLCVSILIEPVSLPCSHRLCLKCFNAHVKESLFCPFCRKRLSIWSRQISNSKDSTYVDLALWDKIKAKFPTVVKARLEELENYENETTGSNSNSIEIQNQIMMEEEELWNKVDGGEPGENHDKRDAILTTEKGEILEDLNHLLKEHIEDLEVIRKRESDASQAFILKLEEEERMKEEEERQKLDEQMIADFELAKKLQEEEELNNQINNVNIKPKITPPTTRGKQKKRHNSQIKPSSSSSNKKRKVNNKPSTSGSSSGGSGGSQSSILSFLTSNHPSNSKRSLMDDFFGENVDYPASSTTSSTSTASSFVPFVSSPENFATGSTRKTSTETITNSNSSHFDDENLATDDDTDEYSDFVVKEEYEDDSFREMSPLKRRRVPKDGTPDSLSSEVNSHFRPIKTAPRTPPSKILTADSLNNCLAKPKPTYTPGDMDAENSNANTGYFNISN